VARADVIRLAFLRYHAGEITTFELLCVLADWRKR